MGAPRIDLVSSMLNPFANADMRFFQRALSRTGMTTDQYVADRYKYFANLGTVTGSRMSSGGPSSTIVGRPFPNFYRTQVTATATPTAAQRGGVQQLFEGQYSEWMFYRRAKIGFLIRSPLIGAYTLNIVVLDSLAAATASYIVPFTIQAANTWEPKIFEVDLRGALSMISPVLNTSAGMSCSIIFGAGPDITNVSTPNQWNSIVAIGSTLLRAVSGQVNLYSSNSNFLDLTAFRMMPIDYEGQNVDLWAQSSIDPHTDFQRCLRYFEKSYHLDTPLGAITSDGSLSAHQLNAGGINLHPTISYKQSKRVPGALTLYSITTGTSGVWRDTTNNVDRSTATIQNGTNYSVLSVSLVPTGALCLGHFANDAEL